MFCLPVMALYFLESAGIAMHYPSYTSWITLHRLVLPTGHTLPCIYLAIALYYLLLPGTTLDYFVSPRIALHICRPYLAFTLYHLVLIGTTRINYYILPSCGAVHALIHNYSLRTAWVITFGSA